MEPAPNSKRRRFWLLLPVALIAALVGLPVIAAWMLQHAEQLTIDCYMQENVAEILIEHLERNDGQWPRKWSDLAEAREIRQAEGGGNWSFEELQQRCSIDFTANRERMATQFEKGKAAPFRVVWLNSGKRHHWSGGEPNDIIYRYLQSRSSRPAGYKPPAHLVNDEATARQALLQLGAQWRVNAGGHVVFVHMGTPRFSDADLRQVAALSKLRELILSGSSITDSGLEHIAGLKNLKSLDLNSTRITDEGLRHLQQLAELETLSLASVRVTDDGLKHLVKVPLKTLNLNMTDVSDTGIEYLCQMLRLEDIMVGETRVTSSGAAQLKKCFPAARIYWAERQRKQ